MLMKSLTPEQQVAWDFAVRRRVAGTARQQRGRNRDQPPSDASQSAPASSNGSFRPARASIQPAAARYPSASLLGAPLDIRLLIYALAEDDIKSSASQWNGKPKTPYDSLRLVSRQMYHELEDNHWQHWLVRQNQVKDLFNLQFFNEGIVYCKKTGKMALNSTSPILKRFKCLTIEIDLASDSKLLAQLTIAIQTLPLTELLLFFTGKDGHGTQTSTRLCGLRPASSFKKLPATGQRFSDRARLINALTTLKNLETLVISNANLPVTFNQVVNNKPRLSKLSVVPDRRTSLSYDWQAAAQQSSNQWLKEATRGSNINLNVKVMPPLLELEIGANAMLFSSDVAKNALKSLEKLTWIVPDPSHQAGDVPGRNLNWLEQTKDLLFDASVLSNNGSRLRTLRICFEQSLYESTMNLGRNDEYEVGELVNTLETELRSIRSLRNLELHMDYVCKFKCDGFYFVTAIGDPLERYYISEKMITADSSTTPHAYVNAVLLNDHEFSDEISLEKGDVDSLPARFSLSVHHYLAREVAHDNFNVPSFHSFKNDKQLSPAQEEHLEPRTDKISNEKNLAFLGYEFTDKHHNLLRIVESTDTHPITPAANLSIDDEDRLHLLRLNGRLLDRHRNKHVYAADYQPPSAESETLADPARLPARHYPVVVRPGKHEHWMCEL